MSDCPDLVKLRRRGASILGMDAFPDFMKNPANRILRSNQATPGVEGYVFDGIDGSQMAFWTCSEDAESAAHMHDCDEYMLVVQGSYTLITSEKRIPVRDISAPGEGPAALTPLANTDYLFCPRPGFQKRVVLLSCA